MHNKNLLFSRGDLRGLFAQIGRALTKAIDTWNADDLLSQPEADIMDRLYENFSIKPIALDRDGIEAEPARETLSFMMQFGEQVQVPTTSITIVIPFSGDPDLFQLQASTHSFNPPRGEIRGNELRITWEGRVGDGANAKKNLNDQVDAVERHLEWSNRDIEQFNQQLRRDIASSLQRRKTGLLANRDLESSIGFPLRKREGASAYSVPVKRRKVEYKSPSTAASPFKPEPAIAEATYEEVLGVLRNARNQLERSPSLTSTYGEEEIRDQLLLALNAQFMGAAMGEVFNYQGKTDILIRAEDRNVFIGECKIWKGPKTITDGLNQLLSYLAWRDTKAAFVLFIREGNVTDIISKANRKIIEHPNFKRKGTHHDPEERSNYVFSANEDANREIKLAFLPFHLPKAKQGRTQSMD